MKIGVFKESGSEPRVSLLPEHISTLTQLNCSVLIEQGAGENAFARDEDYEKAGASIASRSEVAKCDLVLSIHLPLEDSISKNIYLGNYTPLSQIDKIKNCAAQGATVMSLDNIPRTTRAQSMDILSSQANIAGYKAVLIAAAEYARYFPMFMTAAGSIAPAKVLILGAGVAGLQAIATARRLGAVVEVFDTRPAVKEEVKSLGAKFIEVEGAADASQAGGYAVEQSDEFKAKQAAKIAEHAIKSDIIITTAQIPGKKAPILITEEVIKSMRSGSVIMDLASSTGGNTPFTRDQESIVLGGVKIIGNSNLAATAPSDASKLYGKNILNYLALIINKEGNYHLNLDDDIVAGATITNAGEIINDRILNFIN
jgi:NAD(P) transhydrogenase subunit alpha